MKSVYTNSTAAKVCLTESGIYKMMYLNHAYEIHTSSSNNFTIKIQSFLLKEKVLPFKTTHLTANNS